MRPQDTQASLVEALQSDLARHAAFGTKVSGGEGDLATADWITDRLASLGFELARQETEVPHFAAADARLMAGKEQAPVYTQAPAVPTGPGGVSGRLVTVRSVDEAANVEGAIALVVLPHARHASLGSPLVSGLLEAVACAGARAVVLVPTGPSGNIVAFNAPLAPTHALPMAVLAPRAAEPFLAAARRHEQATLLLDGALTRRHTPTLHGSLRRGLRWLVLSTPRTGWFTCASERGTGTAAFLAIARWAVTRFPEHSIYALNTGAHEYLFAGAHAALERAPAPNDTDVWSHLGAGLMARDVLEFRGRMLALPSADPQRFTMATPLLRAAAETAFAGLAGLEHVEPPIEGVSELGAIVARGHARAFAVLGVSRSFHTPDDTLETTDAALLAPVVRAHMAVIEAAMAQAGETP